MNIIIFGDSITQGFWDHKGGWVSRLQKYLTKIILDSNFNSYYSSFNLGISGDNTQELLLRFKEEFQARFAPDDKNFVMVAIGINDSQVELVTGSNKVSTKDFENNINLLISLCKNEAEIIFIGLAPIDQAKVNPMSWKITHGYQTEQVEKYNDTLKNICQTQNVKFLNLLEKFKDINFNSMLLDGVHPNDQGHELIFKEVVKFLKFK